MTSDLFWRAPIIRHIRWAWYAWQVRRHYAFWASFGYYETNDFDRQQLAKIWRGER